MSEMIERVARVLEPLSWAALGTGDTLAFKNRRTSSLWKARRVIEPMRCPTEEMIDAGLTEDGGGHDDQCNRNIQVDAYRAMIDAALGKGS